LYKNGKPPAADRLLPRSSLRFISLFPELNSSLFILMISDAATNQSIAAPQDVCTKYMSLIKDGIVESL